MGKNAMVIGATGMTGSIVVQKLVNSDLYDRVYIVHYKSTRWEKEQKTIETIIDFSNFESLKTKEIIDDFFCCIGSTIKTAGSPEKFRMVDLEFVKNASNWAKKNNVNHFLVISSVGANSNSGNLYLKTKGEMENHVKELDFPKLTIIRPPLLYGEKRPDFRIKELLGKWVLIPLGWFSKSLRPIKIRDLAHQLIKLANQPSEKVNIIGPKELHS